MARGVATQANHSATGEKTALKRRVRGKIPLKPKGSFALPALESKRAKSGQGLAASLNPYSSVPRVIRTRIERATEPSKNRKAKRAQVEGDLAGKNQPLARSPNGKVALGPWSGPFGSGSFSDEELPVLYLDRSGSAHLGLDGEMAEDSAVTKRRHSTGTNAKRANQLMVQAALHPQRSNKEMNLHGLEISNLQSKPLARDNLRGGSHAKKGHVGNRIGMINQPRRS